MDSSPPGSSVHEMSQQKYWSELPFPSLEDLPDAGTEPASPESPALAGGFFSTAPLGEDLQVGYILINPSKMEIS